jgi:heat shock protein HslJ
MNSIGAFLALLILAGCASPPPLNTTPPSGEWVLESLGGPVDRDLQRPTITFSAGRISGFAGCNRYFGQRATEPGGAPYFSSIGATKMACIGPAMELEQRYLAGLERTRDARVVDHRLVLFDADDREIMHFTQAVADPRRSPS